MLACRIELTRFVISELPTHRFDFIDAVQGYIIALDEFVIQIIQVQLNEHRDCGEILF